MVVLTGLGSSGFHSNLAPKNEVCVPNTEISQFGPLRLWVRCRKDKMISASSLAVVNRVVVRIYFLPGLYCYYLMNWSFIIPADVVRRTEKEDKVWKSLFTYQIPSVPSMAKLSTVQRLKVKWRTDQAWSLTSSYCSLLGLVSWIIKHIW